MSAEEKPKSPTKQFLQRWLINTLAVLVACNVVTGIRYDSVTGLFIASLLLGVLNAVLRPLLLLLSIPLLILTLGFFFLVINALLLLLVDYLVEPFHVDGFWPAFWGGLVISLVAFMLNIWTGTGDSKLSVRRAKSAPVPPRRERGDDGPVIDV